MENNTKAALLVIDVQKGLFERPTPIYRTDQLLKNIIHLIERAHKANIPVYYVQHANKNLLVEGTEDWQLHPLLQPLYPYEVIHKRHGSAFQETSLEAHLSAQGIKQVVITGLVTHGCVKATCLDALKRGYVVTVVEDGHSSFSKDAAELIEMWNGKLRAAGAEIKPTKAIGFG